MPDLFFFFKCFSLEPQFEFSIFPVFFTKTRRWLVDAWSKTWGAYVQPSMVLAWVARGTASQTFAMQILEDLFPFSKVFCSICVVFFKGSLEIRKNKHKSQVPLWKLKLKTKKDRTFQLQSIYKVLCSPEICQLVEMIQIHTVDGSGIRLTSWGW